MAAQLHAIKTQRDMDSEAVVALLEQHLTAARSGEYCQCAFIGVRRDGSTSTHSSGGDYFHPLISGLEIMKFRLLLDARPTEVSA